MCHAGGKSRACADQNHIISFTSPNSPILMTPKQISFCFCLFSQHLVIMKCDFAPSKLEYFTPIAFWA